MPTSATAPEPGSPTGDDRRVALVTGAGRGIGRGVAVRLSQQGYRVALTARSADELRTTAESCAGETLVLPADLIDPAVPDRLVDAVEQAWGAPSVLVANAGEGLSAPIASFPDDVWERQLALNLTAPFRCVRRVVPGMVDAGWGRIVVVASVAAKRGEPYIAGYTAAKHGVLGLVRSVAAELARTGVTANAVCPAYVDTAMTDGTVATIVAQTGRSPEEARRILERKQPTGRLITVDEVVDTVWFCVANSGVSGQGLNVDGGAVQG
jgi:NAD(P)-dependent dehydrogenase (short-subunit alcohol dehydrogenase family)